MFKKGSKDGKEFAMVGDLIMTKVFLSINIMELVCGCSHDIESFFGSIRKESRVEFLS